MLKRLFINAVLAAVVIAGAGVAYYQWSLLQALEINQSADSFEVSAGESWGSVLNRLGDLGVLEHPWVAKIYIKQNKLAGELKKGEFALPKLTTLPQLLELLCSNQHVVYKLTFVEGTRFEDALELLAKQPKLLLTINDQTHEQLLEKLKLAVPASITSTWQHTEGLIYPDTYTFQKGDTDFSILVRAHRKLVEELEREWSTRAEKLPYKSAYEALTMASIVEKETGHPSERAQIAGVFVRRLDKGMRLQTDPTVIYGLGDRYQGNITRAHLKEKTPYNTYRIKGLPPTPIALAGREAIQAALHPEAGKALYFVAKGDGSHQFSETIHQHNQAVRKYQLKRRSDYRSTHQVPAPSDQ